ncbi:MAG TPA: SMR family transporter [Tepidisphaeraceae bacterium]
MTIGYLLLVASLAGFGLLGIFHKVADHPACRPRMITMLLLMWGTVFTGAYAALFDSRGLHAPGKVLVMGAVAGFMSSMALFAFQASLRFGKISTSWLVINLCVSVPMLLSILVYGEKVTVGKGVGILMVFGAIVLLWWDKKRDLERSGADRAGAGSERTEIMPAPAPPDVEVQGSVAVVDAPAAVTMAARSLWLPLILLAFLANGLAASSQKVLVEWGGGDYAWQFYVVLYAAGCLVMAAANAMQEGKPHRREVVTSAAMGVASVAGNICIVKALERVPGSVAYPVANGGSLFLVVLAGVLIFKEHVNPAGIAGIIVGIAAIVVLVLC